MEEEFSGAIPTKFIVTTGVEQRICVHPDDGAPATTVGAVEGGGNDGDGDNGDGGGGGGGVDEETSEAEQAPRGGKVRGPHHHSVAIRVLASPDEVGDAKDGGGWGTGVRNNTVAAATAAVATASGRAGAKGAAAGSKPQPSELPVALMQEADEV